MNTVEIFENGQKLMVRHHHNRGWQDGGACKCCPSVSGVQINLGFGEKRSLLYGGFLWSFIQLHKFDLIVLNKNELWQTIKSKA
ncbi:MAG: hypothetical protein WCO56_00940 [Verrucomicrobiota bacterium]